VYGITLYKELMRVINQTYTTRGAAMDAWTSESGQNQNHRLFDNMQKYHN